MITVASRKIAVFYPPIRASVLDGVLGDLDNQTIRVSRGRIEVWVEYTEESDDGDTTKNREAD